eukprot:356800-Rhodomonas_salina.1
MWQIVHGRCLKLLAGTLVFTRSFPLASLPSFAGKVSTRRCFFPRSFLHAVLWPRCSIMCGPRSSLSLAFPILSGSTCHTSFTARFFSSTSTCRGVLAAVAIPRGSGYAAVPSLTSACVRVARCRAREAIRGSGDEHQRRQGAAGGHEIESGSEGNFEDVGGRSWRHQADQGRQDAAARNANSEPDGCPHCAHGHRAG